MEFGVTLPFENVAEFAAMAERLGYDYVTSGDHVAFHGPQANAFVILSVAAGATDRIKLLSTATLLPLYPAALVAKMSASLDVASGGRFNLGVGVGGEYPPEFAACGVPVEERGARANEALRVIRRLLSEDDVSFEGTFNRFESVTISPRGSARVPIWVAGRKEPAMRRAARFGDAWMPYMYTPEQLETSLDVITREAERFGRRPDEITPSVFSWACVYEDADRARRTASEVVSEVYRQDFSKLVHRYVIAGSPESCRQRIRQYADAGAQVVLLNFACPREDMPDMLRLFAEDVMPDFRRAEVASA